jgi:hypothetical protein
MPVIFQSLSVLLYLVRGKGHAVASPSGQRLTHFGAVFAVEARGRAASREMSQPLSHEIFEVTQEAG